ncbi:SNARE associated Golgi protein-like protein [Thalassoporum mexicanum PCC 7367]|nr:TVP38/TMEM64 family protein [Pseudanabaena sp. PCC 7367]AFY68539.1 SNARE associated Golgi protein-like protein [Pseudanabaena sp. PCC 7367]
MPNCDRQTSKYAHAARQYRWRRWLKRGVRGSLWLILIVLIFSVTPLKKIFDQDALVMYLEMLGFWAPVLFVLVYALITMVGMPGLVPTLAGGVVFGVFWGTVWSAIGATLGAIGAFLLARYFLNNRIEKWLGQYCLLNNICICIEKQQINVVIAVRFSPIAPFNIINFLFGLTPVNIWPYSIGTFIGIIPGTFAYTWLGASGNEAMHSHDGRSLFFALLFLTILAILPILWRSARNKLGNNTYNNTPKPGDSYQTAPKKD